MQYKWPTQGPEEASRLYYACYIQGVQPSEELSRTRFGVVYEEPVDYPRLSSLPEMDHSIFHLRERAPLWPVNDASMWWYEIDLSYQLEQNFGNRFEVVHYSVMHELQQLGVSFGPTEIFTSGTRLPALANPILWHLPYQMTSVDRAFYRVLPFPWRAIREICKLVERDNKRRYYEEVIKNRRIANSKTQQEFYQAASTLQALARRRS
jgi:hypothetical protein